MGWPIPCGRLLRKYHAVGGAGFMAADEPTADCRSTLRCLHENSHRRTIDADQYRLLLVAAAAAAENHHRRWTVRIQIGLVLLVSSSRRHSMSVRRFSHICHRLGLATHILHDIRGELI